MREIGEFNVCVVFKNGIKICIKFFNFCGKEFNFIRNLHKYHCFLHKIL